MPVFCPGRWLFALIVLITGLAAAPAFAQTCKVSNVPAFGTVEIGTIASIGEASTNASIEFECPESDGLHDFLICTYIQPANANDSADPSANRFYLRQNDGNSRLIWRGEFDSGKTGRLKLEKRPGLRKGSMQLKITYPAHSRQDFVRAGMYRSTYQLISETHDQGMQDCTDTPAGGNRSTITFDLATKVLPVCQMENKGQTATDFDPIDFGTQGSIAAAEAAGGKIRATTNIDVRCTYETPYTLDLDNGKNFEGGTRRMKNADHFLAYQLFSKTASGTSSPWSTVSGIGNTINMVNKHTVEGQLTTPLAVAPAAGNYTDMIVVTLTF